MPLFFPIFYRKKGKTFSNCKKWRVHDIVMDACMEQNVDVLATSFDGECFSLLTEDKEGNPLTLTHLQHKVFDQVRKLDKRQIIKDIILHSKTTGKEKEKLKEINETYLESGKVFVSSVVLPKKPYTELHKAIAVNLTMKEMQERQQQTMEMIPPLEVKVILPRKVKLIPLVILLQRMMLVILPEQARVILVHIEKVIVILLRKIIRELCQMKSKLQ